MVRPRLEVRSGRDRTAVESGQVFDMMVGDADCVASMAYHHMSAIHSGIPEPAVSDMASSDPAELHYSVAAAAAAAADMALPNWSKLH